MLLDAADDDVRAALSAGLAPASVVVVTARRGVDGIVSALHVHGRFDVVVDATTSGDRSRLFRETVWAVRDGGRYVAVRAGRAWVRAVSDRGVPTGGAVLAGRRRAELVESAGVPTSARGVHVVEKTHDHHAVLRHAEVEQVLAARHGDDWGTVLTRQDAYRFTSRAGLVMHGEPADAAKPAVVEVPELTVRAYRDVTCHVREIVTRDDLVLPDTYRHWQSRTLFHKRIVPSSPRFGRLVDEVAQATAVRHEGVFFGLDSAFPTHFGHLMTETVSRAWGWRLAAAQHPGLRPVMTHQSGKEALPRWKADVLAALGVPTDDVLWVREGEAATVETLVAAMPQMANPHYVDENIRETWARIVSGLGPDPIAGRRPERIFLSRRGQRQRTCGNTDEVEAFFEDLGFAIVVPEELTFAEQVHAFRAAKVVAGFGGSALFSAMFNPDARLVVLSSRSYVAANEYLIAAANGNEIHYFWAPASIEQPRAGFSAEAYRSGFEFPIDEHREALTAVCR